MQINRIRDRFILLFNRRCLAISVKAELNVNQADCNHCKSIQEIIAGFQGIESVNVYPEAKKVTITFDDHQTNLVDLKQAIMTEGYTVVEI